jgi:hypothetical protein
MPVIPTAQEVEAGGLMRLYLQNKGKTNKQEKGLRA